MQTNLKTCLLCQCIIFTVVAKKLVKAVLYNFSTENNILCYNIIYWVQYKIIYWVLYILRWRTTRSIFDKCGVQCCLATVCIIDICWYFSNVMDLIYGFTMAINRIIKNYEVIIPQYHWVIHVCHKNHDYIIYTKVLASSDNFCVFVQTISSTCEWKCFPLCSIVMKRYLRNLLNKVVILYLFILLCPSVWSHSLCYELINNVIGRADAPVILSKLLRSDGGLER